MNARFFLLTALLAGPFAWAGSPPPALESVITTGTFTGSNRTGETVILWSERGIVEIGAVSATASHAALILPCQSPGAEVHLLLNTNAALNELDFKFKLRSRGNLDEDEPLLWEFAGVPIRLAPEEDGHWQMAIQTAPETWVSLRSEDDELADSDWHSLQLEFSQPQKAFRIRWDKGAAGPWLAARDESWFPVLILRNDGGSELWVADVYAPFETGVSRVRLESATREGVGTPPVLVRTKQADVSRMSSDRRASLVQGRASASRISTFSPKSLRREGTIRLQVLTSLEERNAE